MAIEIDRLLFFFLGNTKKEGKKKQKMFSIKQADMTKQQQQKTSFGLNDYATNMRFRLVITQLGNWSIYFRTTYSALHLLYIYIQRNTP